MNLSEMLSYADIHQLSRIANHYECECNGHSKNELIQSILSKINRREVFEKLIEGSSLEDLRFLNSLLFDQRNSFSLEELLARVELTRFIKDGNESFNPREMITKFKQRGWLFNGFSQQTKYLFQVPQDLKKRFSDTLTKHFLNAVVTIEAPAIYRDEQMLIRDDIQNFLKYIQNDEIMLTAEGFMYKRYVQQLLERLSVTEAMVQKKAWRFGYGRRFKEYPNRLSLIYDYCYFHQLINEQHDILTLTEKGIEQMRQGKKEDLAEVYRFWLKLYKVPIKNLQSFVYWINQLAQQWVTVDSLKEIICDLIKPFYYDDAGTILEQRILQMMMHLGLLKIGEDETSGKVVQMTKLGSSIISGIYVPDNEQIEISVTPN
jgi:hypothetical protein